MRKVILILLIFVCKLSDAQVYQLMPQYGYDAKRMKFDSTLQIPTTCGVPTLRSTYTKYSAIAFDTCNNRFYVYNSKTLVWDTLKGGTGGGGTIDTTSLSNRINQRIDSLKRSNDSVFARKNGVFVFQYKDSIGTGGGGSTDTTSLSNRINNAYTTITKLTDTSFFLTKPNTLKDTIKFNKDVVYTENPILTRVSNDSTIIYLNADSLSSWRNTGYVPYVGATQDVDLDANKISARSVYIEGTNGDGHLHLKHQSADATATGQSTSLYADSNGDIKWKNDGNYYTTLKTSTNTANRIYTYPDTSTTLIGAADTSVFQRKNIAAYSFKANNTGSAANVTDQVFRDPSIQTYSQTITWTGTTAPSGATNHTYNWTRVGNIVTLNVTLVYATAGSALTAVAMPLPTDCPAPKEQTGLGAASEILYFGSGQMTTSNTATNTSVSRCFLRVNSADNGYELGISGASGAYKNALLTIQYFVN